jgi:hypothetical protein
MRDASLYVTEYREKYGRQPHPLTGVIHFLKCKSIIEIIKQASSVNPNSDSCFKYNAYNFQGIAHRGIGFGDSKLTVEFRQHAATMDAEAVIVWIETVVGIVDYIRNIDNVSLTNLLQIVEYETWEKLGDGKDDEREARFGPILAESKFTIIDLLEGMELYSSAKYYRNHWKKLAKRTPNLRNPKTDIVWEYEDRLDPETDEYKHLHRLRENWEADRIAFEAQPPGGSWKFQPYHPRWPLHRNIVDPTYVPQFYDSDEGKNSGQAASFDSGAVGRDGAAPIHDYTWDSPERQTFRSLNYNPEKTEEGTETDLDAEEAEVDRQIRALEAAERAEVEQEDAQWRGKVKDGHHDGKRMFKGTGVIPKGSMNPFDNTLPRTRKWSGQMNVPPEVSPKTVSVEDEESDGEMPFLVRK